MAGKSKAESVAKARERQHQLAASILQYVTQLQGAVQQVQAQRSFQNLLDVMSSFHRYSLGNQLLIAIQRPDATRVAGMSTWNKLGRRIAKGQKAIWVWAPISGKSAEAQALRDIPLARVLDRAGAIPMGDRVWAFNHVVYTLTDDGFTTDKGKRGRNAVDLAVLLFGGYRNAVNELKAIQPPANAEQQAPRAGGGAAGDLDQAMANEDRAEAARQRADSAFVRFRLVKVWDVGQTEGDPLPEADRIAPTLTGAEGEQYARLSEVAQQALQAQGIAVERGDTGDPSILGRARPEANSLIVRDGLAAADDFAALVHEGAHVLLHQHSSDQHAVKEIEAEAIAYVVCRHFGVPTAAPNYIALQGESPDLIKARLKNISAATKTLVTGMTKVLAPELEAAAQASAPTLDSVLGDAKPAGGADVPFSPFGQASDPAAAPTPAPEAAPVPDTAVPFSPFGQVDGVPRRAPAPEAAPAGSGAPTLEESPFVEGAVGVTQQPTSRPSRRRPTRVRPSPNRAPAPEAAPTESVPFAPFGEVGESEEQEATDADAPDFSGVRF